jgi:hypothetical protein|tara:strand:+ start:1190 stop:1579 length:390 start_codon:yes stop_codon:yes gene_type:complete
MDSVSVKPKPSFDQSISGLVIALFTARFPLVILFSRLLLFNILFFSLLLLLNLLFCIIGLRLPAAEDDDDDAEEEATTLELFETVGRKTIVVVVEDALDAIIFSRSVFVFSLSLSLSTGGVQHARRCEK